VLVFNPVGKAPVVVSLTGVPFGRLFVPDQVTTAGEAIVTVNVCDGFVIEVKAFEGSPRLAFQ
jgi:hypothetical protein